MSHTQSNRVFASIMGAAFLCAFVLPTKWTEGVGVQLASVFTPISGPTRWLARGIYDRFKHGPEASDEYTGADVAEMKNLIFAQQTRIDELEKLDAELQRLGNIRDQCVRVDVSGADTSGQDALILSGSYLSGLTDGQPALYDGGIAGRVVVGLAGARVQLLSDKGMVVGARFVRLARGKDGRLVDYNVPSPPPAVEGIGDGRMEVPMLTVAEAHDVHVGDSVVLSDPNWPAGVQGWSIGTVTWIGMRPQRDFAVIVVEPAGNLLKTLRAVEVYRGS
ncbi:MAG TPA: rod shape-determining protein MreC [Tepidisphaeraceae bacterium]|nr:rod shape-determining protein MreC [Tepidisphaeraceae bacterium]